MKRFLSLFAVLSLILVSCGENGKINDPNNFYLEEARMIGPAYTALNRAGIDIKELDNVIGLGVAGEEFDSKGNGTHYYQVSATKGNTAYIYLMNYVVEGQGNKYVEYNMEDFETFNLIKTYSFPITQKELVVDHGYGEKETLHFGAVHLTRILHSGSNYYGALINMYIDGEYPNINKHQETNPRLLMDQSGSVKDIPYEYVTENIPTGGLVGYDNGLWAGYNGSVICGPYCFSKTGTVLFQTSAWSDLYNSNVYYASFGTWYFPISEKEMFIVDFETSNTKANPQHVIVKYIWDNIETGNDVYRKSMSISDEANVYSYAKFVSEKNGIYKFSIDATVYSGDQKTFNVTIDRLNQTCVVE